MLIALRDDLGVGDRLRDDGTASEQATHDQRGLESGPPGSVRYDEIGVGYSLQRQPEPEWAAAIGHAIGDAKRVVNVGAGTGNYEPADRLVIGVEPSAEMLSQRSQGCAVQGFAETLPFRDRSFDVAMGVLTVHHWRDQAAGLREMRRVADRQVLFIFEPLVDHSFWLTNYFETTGDYGYRLVIAQN